MIVVEKQYRRLKIGKLLATKFIDKIREKGMLCPKTFS